CDRPCSAIDHPYTPAALKVRFRSRWTVVWSLGSGVANDVDYVAAELPADGPRTLHECDAAGVLPSEAAAMESRVGRGIQPDLAEHAGRKPRPARSRRSCHGRDRSLP